KLLVVDDDPVSRKLVSLLLKHNGHSVSTASNGKEGIKRAKSGSFDAILMDVHMPVMNGEEAVAAIRADSNEKMRQIPVIGMTASVLGIEKEKYLEAGMTDVVEKPVIF
ncbi:MAG: response regulator, partial [Aliifodinibius sp.]|nr:response regulator [Fodinibius sp.]NIV15132.1 response regulator [Fodinibius sp.]NIY28970.1 response regulator [Fodinibius sp.]